ATLLTPNRAEFRQVMGSWKSEKEFAAKARQLMRKLNLKALLVTRGEEGMTLFSGGSMLNVKAQAREVFDVSGAGDTVIAVLGVMLASGATLPEAVRIANRAAGIVVGKLGTAVVLREELFAA
ncbi:MAG: bifunctional heptose 7-phosphate kinase/heptose 1-phosphate adenyltransferase, partial [Burkholderiales bacterium]